MARGLKKRQGYTRVLLRMPVNLSLSPSNHTVFIHDHLSVHLAPDATTVDLSKVCRYAAAF